MPSIDGLRVIEWFEIIPGQSTTTKTTCRTITDTCVVISEMNERATAKTRCSASRCMHIHVRVVRGMASVCHSLYAVLIIARSLIYGRSVQVRSGTGAYAGAARRRVHLATVLLRPQSGHRPGRRQARQAAFFR